MRRVVLALLLLGVLGAWATPASAFPVAAGNADLGVSIADDTDPISAGNDLGYTITVTNNGPSAADATLADALPTATTFNSMDTPSGWSCNTPAAGAGGSISCSTASIAAGSSTTFTLSVHLASDVSDGGALSNMATVSTDASDQNSGNNSATETTTIENNADIGITKTASADTVLPGGTLMYTIDVSNAGPSDAANVEWDDPLPSDVTFLSESQASGPTFVCSTPSPGSGGTVSCAVSSLPAGSTASFTIQVLVSPTPSHGSISNTATVRSDTHDLSETGNNSSTVTTPIQSASDLSVTKTDFPDPVTAGNTLTYTITVTNNGAVPVGDVVLTDEVPDNTSFSSLAGGPRPCSTPDPGSGGTIECTIPSLGAGNHVTYTLKVAVLANVENGTTITNTASVGSSTNTDPDSSNDSATATTTVQASADLSATNSDSPDPVLAGNDITYTIPFINNGPNSAHNVSFADTIPSGTEFVSIDAPSGFDCSTSSVNAGGTVSCSGGTVDPAEGGQFVLTLRVLPSDAAGSMISDTATLGSSTPEANPGDESASASTTVNTQADVAVAKSGSPDAVPPTGEITYTIDVTNNGPSDASNVSMSDTLPPDTSFKSLDQDSGPVFSCTTGGVVTCTAATLAAGAKATFTLVVTVGANANGTITNAANVSTTTAESTGANNGDSASTQVQPQADLAVTKSDSPDPVTAGTDLTYTLGVKNNGPQDASNVTLSDALPAGTTFQSISAPAGFTCTTPAVGAGGNVSCTASTLANGASASFTLVVHVAADRANGSTLSNTASVSRDEADPNSANDSATSTTSVGTSADLSTSVTDSPDPVNAGDVVTYHMQIHNGGPSDASQPRLTVPIPSGTTLIGAGQTDGSAFHCTSNGTTVTCAAGSLANGGAAAIDMAVKTARSQTGTISVSPKASSSTSDPNGSNDASSETTTMTPATAQPTRVAIGRTVTKRRSGSILVTIACAGSSGQTCLVGVTVTFQSPHDDLPPITGTKTIETGRRRIVYVIGSHAERLRIKRIHSLPVHVDVTNSNGTGATRDTTIVGTH
jgi:uncharacterized repeat protein (TIGR01451 family)